MKEFLLFPPEASLEAHRVDSYFFVLLAISALVILLVTALIAIFAVRYRRGSSASRDRLPALYAHEVEIAWSVATLLVFLGIFWWATAMGMLAPPAGRPLEIRIVAKQWMWKSEHPGGAREINALHLPVDVPVRLSMTSQDVIHSFYVPAFREKQDVLPDRVTTLRFTPSLVGDFALRCAEYCGTGHAAMVGRVTVMPQGAYAEWAAANGHPAQSANGAALFEHLGCAACHNDPRRAPGLVGLYGRSVTLADGRHVTADDAYLERSLVDPRAQIVRGYPPVMPTYRKALTGGDMADLLAYLKSLSDKESAP